MRFLVALGAIMCALVLVTIGSPVHAQSTCHVVSSGQSVGTSFGLPWNPLSAARELLVRVSCTASTATLSVGTGGQNQYIYNQAYLWSDGSWQPLTLSGGALVSNVWLTGSGESQIQLGGLAPNTNHFVVAYMCQWTGQPPQGQGWKCGCADQSCTQPNWQLQAFNFASGGGGNGGSQQTGGTSGWWNTQMNYRVPVTASAGDYARRDAVAEAELNLSSLTSQAGGSGTPDPDSVRVVEVNSAGTTIDQAVPFQFDATGNTGELTIIMEDETAAGAERTYHVYFNTTGATTPANQSPSLISVEDGVVDEHEQSIKVTAQNATYFMHKVGAGFSSMIDSEGNDWIAYKGPARQTDGAGGWWRGIPAFLPIDVGNGGLFHPGFPSGSAELVSSGRVKATIRTSSNNAGGWEVLWDIYPTFTKMRTVDTGNGNYSILCECAPGGETEVARDYSVRPNGSRIPANQEVLSDIPGEDGIEWTYAGDDNLDRVLYMTHNDDNAADSTYTLNGNGGLFVMGFGRNKFTRTISGGPQEAIFAFAETTDHAEVKEHAFSAAKAVATSIGSPEAQ